MSMANSDAPSVTLAPTARSCTEGRRFVTQTLIEWGLLGLLDAAALLASEVITNAVLHARTVVTLTVVRTDPGTVRIDVTTARRMGPCAGRPTPRTPTAGASDCSTAWRRPGRCG